MDNITHTLVGAALAQAGLKKRTALGTATLMIGANFPDIDVAALAFPNSLDIRRGVTHGLPAHAVLPFVLAWLVYQYDRRVRLRRNPEALPADPRQLLLLAALSVWTHPALDFMNVYGMRWLMPFLNKWYYADALFIADLWILAALGLGVWWSRRTAAVKPARIALGGVAVYIVAMLGVTEAGRSAMARTAAAGRGEDAALYMVGPTPLVPWQREVILDDGLEYRFGHYSLFGSVRMTDFTITKGDTADPTIAAARAAPEARGFLNWARFPFYRIESAGPERRVRIADARYVGPNGAGWASVLVRLP